MGDHILKLRIMSISRKMTRRVGVFSMVVVATLGMHGKPKIKGMMTLAYQDLVSTTSDPNMTAPPTTLGMHGKREMPKIKGMMTLAYQDLVSATGSMTAPPATKIAAMPSLRLFSKHPPKPKMRHAQSTAAESLQRMSEWEASIEVPKLGDAVPTNTN